MGNQRLVFGVGTTLVWVSLYGDENTALTHRDRKQAGYLQPDRNNVDG